MVIQSNISISFHGRRAKRQDLLRIIIILFLLFLVNYAFAVCCCDPSSSSLVIISCISIVHRCGDPRERETGR